MITATIPAAVEDPAVAAELLLSPDLVEIRQPFFLHGPIAARVAVVARDPNTGAVTPVPWLPRDQRFDTPVDLTDPAATAASAFAIVLKTLEMFEREDVLGHPISWQFGSPQLLVVPHAGDWANACYDRYSRSLQFYSFLDEDGRRVFTAHSRDVVAHETGHAVLDALAPALLDAITPETNALHEGVGDLAAIVMALESPSIQTWLVKKREGALAGASPAAEIARQFGRALNGDRWLRNADNEVALGEVRDPLEPHELCEVLIGAVWSAMVVLHAHSLSEAKDEEGLRGAAAQQKALEVSARRIARVLFRALDYMPPAETTFRDYARALLHADKIAYDEDPSGYRETLRQQFVDRGICRAEDLNVREQAPVVADLDALVESDWAAYRFVERNRDLFGLKGRDKDAAFRIFPRRDIHRRYRLPGGTHEERREVVMQVTWEHRERNVDIPGEEAWRYVFRGTTLVLGEAVGGARCPVLSCLSSDTAQRHVDARNAMLKWWVEEGMLVAGDAEATSRAQPMKPVVYAHVTGDAIRVRGAGRLLHLRKRR